LSIEYYQAAFLYFHQQLEERHFSLATPPEIRPAFWSLIPGTNYGPIPGQDLVRQYARRVEKCLAERLGRHCLAYWLHVVRRLKVSYPEAHPTTVVLLRASFEAAARKYARSGYCDSIAPSDSVPQEAILNGEMVRHLPSSFVQRILSANQLVLTKFDADALEDFYRCEQLAYELWRCAACLRILGKGAHLSIVGHPKWFADARTPELDEAVGRFDNRYRHFDHTLVGTTFASSENRDGYCLMPSLNVNDVSGAEVLRVLKVDVESPVGQFSPNYLGTPVDLRRVDVRASASGRAPGRYSVLLEQPCVDLPHESSPLRPLCSFVGVPSTAGLPRSRPWPS